MKKVEQFYKKSGWIVDYKHARSAKGIRKYIYGHNNGIRKNKRQFLRIA